MDIEHEARWDSNFRAMWQDAPIGLVTADKIDDCTSPGLRSILKSVAECRHFNLSKLLCQALQALERLPGNGMEPGAPQERDGQLAPTECRIGHV